MTTYFSQREHVANEVDNYDEHKTIYKLNNEINEDKEIKLCLISMI